MRIIHANIDSVSKNGSKLQTLIDMYNPAIVGLNETKRKHINDPDFEIPL